MRYSVISAILHWSFTGNSREEAHVKAKSAARKWLSLWKDINLQCYPETRKEIIRVLRGKFEVEEVGEE